MQPYEKANIEQQRQNELPKNYAKKALSLGTTLTSASLFTKAMPFLNKYIPEELAIKGLNKINPNFGKFIKKAFDNGFDFNEIKNFFERKADESLEQNTESTKDDRNIIQKYSPELYQFIDQEVKKGRRPIEAGAIAQNDKRFSKIIEKLSKDHQTPWSSILESIYGSQEQSQPQQPTQQPEQSQGIDPQLAQIMQGIRQSISQIRGR